MAVFNGGVCVCTWEEIKNKQGEIFVFDIRHRRLY